MTHDRRQPSYEAQRSANRKMPESTSQPPSRFRLPISLRLTLWYGLSMLLLLGLFGGLLVTSLHWIQHIVLHQRLFKAQSDLVHHVVVEEGRPRITPALAELGGAFRAQGAFGTYVRLLSPEGQVWEQSVNYKDAVTFEPVLPEQPQIAEVDLEWQDLPFRAFYAPILSEDKLVGWLEVSGFAWQVQFHQVGAPVTMAILVTVLLALGGGYVLARRALKPVAQLTEAANRITASELNIRLPVDTRLRDELTDLAETFNTMIARLSTSFERERRFTADAAHELLNPLAAVRNEAEVALRRPRETAAYQQTLHTILTDVKRLGKMIEQLLQLARLDADADVQRETVEVSRLCREHVAQWEAAAQERQIRLGCRAEEEAFVAVHALHLDAVLDNLLENAVKYTPEGGWVEVAVEADDREVSLSVADSGIGFEPDVAGRLFDRFHRGATPDVHAQPGSGLGLAIVRAIVQAYGGSITAASEGPNRGSRFVVRFPRSEDGS